MNVWAVRREHTHTHTTPQSVHSSIEMDMRTGRGDNEERHRLIDTRLIWHDLVVVVVVVVCGHVRVCPIHLLFITHRDRRGYRAQ